MRTSKRLGVLREPGYRRLLLGRTTSLVGDGMAPVAIAFAVLDLTGSATDLGLVLAAHSVVLIALVLVEFRPGATGPPLPPRPVEAGD